MKKNIFGFVLIILVTLFSFAFEWPQGNVLSSTLFSFFGQKRVQTISNSIVFSESEVAKSTDNGDVSVVITEHDDGFNWFESTLGTAVVISHEDSFLTVYGNLDTNSLNQEIFKNTKVSTGTNLSTTGSSAWQEGNSFLEFQIIDSKNKSYVNPLILMPRLSKYEPLTFSDIILKNKFGKQYALDSQITIPAGVYKIYKNRQSVAVPYEISLILNGTESEKITFDTMTQSKNELTIQGRNQYSINEIYPSEQRMLLGEVYLSHGNNTLTIILTDFARNEKSKVFKIKTY